MKITEQIDLFYPDAAAKERAAERRREIAASGASFAEDLRLDGIRRMISLGNSERFMSLAEELSVELPTVEYRLDCLEDFLNVPELSDTFRRMIAELSGRRPEPEGSGSRVNSFFEIKERMDELTFFLGSITEINSLYRRISGGIRSEAVKKLFAFFEELPQSDGYKTISENLAELRKLFSGSIRSVRIGVNFDSNMIPDSAGIIEVSNEKIYPKGNVVERMIFGGAEKEHFSGEEHLNSLTRHTPPDIDTALFKELYGFTKEYASRIADALRGYRASFFTDISELERQLDYYGSAAEFIKSVRARGLPMCRPKLLPPESRTAELKGIFDLNFYRSLVAEDAISKLSGKIVLNDVEFDGRAGFYTVTGANNGGKTTFARAVGLCQVMAQAGMYVPAESAVISLCDNIFTHFPHEEKLGIDTSRFTEEIKELKDIVCKVTPQSLVILNESLQSTTPEECLQIAGIHLELFAAAGVRGLYVTHLTGLCRRFGEINAAGYPTKVGSLVSETDESGEKRLYKMSRRLPSGESLAFSIYRRFGATLSDVGRSRL